MQYAVIVDPELPQQLANAAVPNAVREAAIEALQGLQEDPRGRVEYHEAIGFYLLVDRWWNGFLYRIAFSVDIREDDRAVWVTSVAINPP